MGEMLNIRLERSVLDWRTRLGRSTSIRYLDDLSASLKPEGWRFVKLYWPTPIPILRIYARGPAEIALMVSALAVPHGLWGYHEAPLGRSGYLHPCGDADAAAHAIGRLLKSSMYPSTAW
ncbi:hypothetical protein ACFOY4_25415 [Actinomadura syzygii]|uniref:Uncharacterized protein n=1 Tax=Actinomadura syzygii TaxID=1427538 RepID=A0A5D0UMA4_9ACTN|nr:hypothetical protein [Actinomadura syzygii]TYC18259.1 hypothetical protein FXF65_00315 [Actinomadura syzygii]